MLLIFGAFLVRDFGLLILSRSHYLLFRFSLFIFHCFPVRISFSKSVAESLLAKIRSGEVMSRNEKFNLIIQLSIPSSSNVLY